MKTLPTKISALLSLALDDLQKARKHPDYEINMGYWRKMDFYQGRCLVCLSGALLSFTLKNKNYCVSPSDFDDETRNRLLALDQLRRGNIYLGLNKMGIPCKEGRYWKIPDYQDNPPLFFRRMRRMARKLAAEGI